MSMTNLEMLFVRACKSMHKNRIYSIYKRYYYNHPTPQENNVYDVHIANILLDICEKYTPIKTKYLLDEINPNALRWIVTNSTGLSYWSKVLSVVIGHIAITEGAKFTGYRLPAWFKNQYKDTEHVN